MSESDKSNRLLTEELCAGLERLELAHESGLDAHVAVLGVRRCYETGPTQPPSSMSAILLPVPAAGFQTTQLAKLETATNTVAYSSKPRKRTL